MNSDRLRAWRRKDPHPTFGRLAPSGLLETATMTNTSENDNEVTETDVVLCRCCYTVGEPCYACLLVKRWTKTGDLAEDLACASQERGKMEEKNDVRSDTHAMLSELHKLCEHLDSRVHLPRGGSVRKALRLCLTTLYETDARRNAKIRGDIPKSTKLPAAQDGDALE